MGEEMSFKELLLSEMEKLRDELKNAEEAIAERARVKATLDRNIKALLEDIKRHPAILSNIPLEEIHVLKACLSRMKQYGAENNCPGMMEDEINDIETLIGEWEQANRHENIRAENKEKDFLGGITMVDSYQSKKEEALRIYEEYREFDWHFKRETLEERAENIRNEKFYLMVVGEAKSGKSTFINAYLGAEILPMDVLQCTSALIEITYGETKILTATYADGREEYRTGEDDIREFLKAHAAIPEEYRNIPVTAINNEILIKSQGHIKPSEVEDLIKAEKPEGRNEDEYSTLVWKYVDEKKDSWQDIVIKITLSYPLSEDLKDVTIIDSPGVNALGMVGDVTEKSLKKADALILAKPLSGAAVEAEPFMKFLSSSARERCKGALLLVLTRKAGIKGSDLVKLLNQAVAQYGEYVPADHIAPVDSKLQLYRSLCEGKTEDEIEDFLEKEAANDALVLWYKSDRKKSVFLKRLEEKSGFVDVTEMLDRFGGQAKHKQLYDFLSLIGQGYDDFARTLKDHFAELEKAKSLEELRVNIDKKKEEIANIQEKMNRGVQKIRYDYTEGDAARIKQCANKEFEQYKKAIQGVTSIDDLKKKAYAGQERFNVFRKDLQKQIISDCNKTLIEYADLSTVKFESLVPVFTEEDLKSIEEDTKNNASERTSYEKKFCSSEYKYGPVYSADMHLRAFREAILRNLENTKQKMVNTITGDFRKITSVYIAELANNANTNSKSLDNLLKRLETEEKSIQEEKKAIEAKLQTIEEKYADLDKIKGGIKNVIS
jgi:GTPase SAR1 family protein